MARYWISWYSGCYEDEGCTLPPFNIWYTGQRERPNRGLSEEKLKEYLAIEDEDRGYEFLDEHGKSDGTVCALVDAKSEDEIWGVIAKYYPDYEVRFCELRDDNYVLPGGRFEVMEPSTSLYETEEKISIAENTVSTYERK